MSHSGFQKSALAAAVLSLGFSMGAYAQGTAGGSASSTMTNSKASHDDTSASADRSAKGSGQMSKSEMSKSDRQFLQEAYVGSMAEVRLGKLAQDKASSAEVKDFARRMVDDHGKEIEKLAKIAKDEGVKLPAQLDSKHQKTYDRLAKLSGAEFDRAYMKEMTSDHKKDVSKYEQAAKSAKDDELQQHAGQAVSTLQEHEKMAESTRDDVRKGSTVSMNARSSASGSGSPAHSQSQSQHR